MTDPVALAPRLRLAKSRLWWAWLAAACAFLAYAAALAGECVFDDVHTVLANPALQAPVDWWRLCSDPAAFSGSAARMYRPTVVVSLAANAWFGAAVPAWKLGNVLLHAAVAWSLVRWLGSWHVPRRAAGAVGVLFAVHPLCSENVNLVSARSEVLLVLFALWALMAHRAALRGKGWLGAFAAALATAGACGSKETGALLPVLLGWQCWLACRHAGDRRTLVRGCLAALPALGVVVGYLWLRQVLLGQATAELLGRAGGDPISGHGRTLSVQLATMGTLVPRALLQVLWPSGLTIDPEVVYRPGCAEPLVLVGWGAVLGLVGAGLLPGRGARLRRLGIAFAAVLALPWIVVPLNMPLAEHRLYGPALGVLVALVPWGVRWARRWPAAFVLQPRHLLAALGLGGIVLSTARSLDYRDERHLWRTVLAERPTAWRAWWGLGAAELRSGQVPAAVAALEQAQALYPEHYDVLRNFVEALVWLPVAQQRPFTALVAAERLAAAGPVDPWARTLLAEAQTQVGRVTGAAEWCRAAEQTALSCLEIAPPKALVYRTAAAACRARGDFAAALAHLDQSLARGLAPVAVRVDRAAVLHELGRPREAKAELLRAQLQDPGDPLVLHALQQAARPAR
jgi:tetratricopeptide (TPR) repeat protein